MGFFDSLNKENKSLPSPDGSALWRRAFGGVNKEDGPRKPASTPGGPGRGGSWAASSVGNKAAQKRLLEALRSPAPGGWTDDRWEESKHWEGIQYATGHRAAEILSEAEFQVYEKDDNHPDGKRAVKKGEPGWGLVELLEKPNPDDSFGDLMYRWYQQMSMTGSALTYMVDSLAGRPMELYSLPTAICTPQPVVNPEFPEGFYRIQPLYPYGPYASVPTPYSSAGAPVDARWMLSFRYPHPLVRYEGYSPYTALRLHIDELSGIDRSRAYKMRKSFNPSVVLNLENMEGFEGLPEAEIERMRAELENEFFGPENAGGLAVPPPGGKLEEFGHTPIDMDYQAGWDQLTSFIMAAQGVTKPVAGMVDESSYANLFAALKQFHLLTLNPICRRFAQRLTRKLAPYFGEHLIVVIRCKRIDDHEVNFNKIDKGIAGKFMTKNEARKLCDMSVTTEPWGEDIVGDPSPNEQMQAKSEQMMAGGAPPPGGGAEMEMGPGPEQDQSAQETQPAPGPLGENSLGPRKSLNNLESWKRFQRAVTGVNGNGHSPLNEFWHR